MTKTKTDYRHLPSTLTHESIVAGGYAPHEGPDGFQRFLNDKDRALTTAQIRAMARYGSFPVAQNFHGTRLAPVYWKKSEIAAWLERRYGHSEPGLVRAAAKAGYVLEGLPPTTHPVPKTVKGGHGTKKKRVTLPNRQARDKSDA